MKKLLLSMLICGFIYPSECPEPMSGQKLYNNVDSALIKKRSELQSYFLRACVSCNAKPCLVRYKCVDEFSMEYEVYNEDYSASILVDEVASACFVTVDVVNEFDIGLLMFLMDCYFKGASFFDTDEDSDNL